MSQDQLFSRWPQLAPDARDLVVLAIWVGELQRPRRSGGPEVPPAHWRDLLAAYLVSDSPTAHWVQIAADRGLLKRTDLLPPGLARRALQESQTQELPQAPQDGWLTRSVVSVLNSAAMVSSSDAETVPVAQVDILANMILDPQPDHERDLRQLATVPELQNHLAKWFIEFPHLHNRYLSRLMPAPEALFPGLQGWPEAAAFMRFVASWRSELPFSPWLAAVMEIAANDPLMNFVRPHEGLLHQALGTGELISNTAQPSVGGTALVERARVIAEHVSPDRPVVMRHLLGALIAGDATLPPLPAEPKGEPEVLRTLRRHFLSFVAKEYPEDRPRAWTDHVLGEALSTVQVVQDTGKKDSLDFVRYARALASVIADKEIVPPFSIGLFGAWGSGKTFLMDRIKDEIADIVVRAEVSDETSFCRGIVPVDFNAWHYAETNLWASLFVRILEALGERLNGPAKDDAGNRRGAVLAEMGRIHAELRAAEDAATKADIDAQEARKQIDDAVAAAEQAGTLDGLRAVIGNLIGWGPAAQNADAAAVLESARRVCDEATRSWQTISGIATIARRIMQLRLNRKFWIAAAAACAIFLLAIIGAVFWHAGLALAGTVLAALTVVGERVNSYRTWIEALRSQYDRAEKAVRTQAAPTIAVLREQQAQRVAVAEASRAKVVALRQQIIVLEVRAQELEPRRLLATFVAGRAASEDYSKLLGVPAMIRRDIAQLTEHLRSAQGGEGAGIDRIILFVDDLDRCPPDTVVRVLEAVHILLASSLFVVVVGVDPRWLRGALAGHFAGLFADDAEERATPTEFLEKIFQVPFWTPEMTPAGRKALVADILPRRTESVAPSAQVQRAGEAEGGANDAAVDQQVQASQPPLPTVRSVQLEAREQQLLLALSAAAGDTPRRLKRFVRCYLVLRASLDRTRLGWLAEPGPGEALARLLAAANGAPQTWQRLRKQLLTGDENRPIAALAQEVAAATTQEQQSLRAAFETPVPREPPDSEPANPRVADLRLWLREIDRFTFPTDHFGAPPRAGSPPATDQYTPAVETRGSEA